MKNKIKTIALVLFALAAFGFTAQAQLGSPFTLVYSGQGDWYAAITNNTVNSGATNTTSPKYAMGTGHKDVTLQIRFQLSDAGTTANNIVLQKSLDGTYWENLTTIATTPAGATYVNVVTNITVGAVPYIRVATWANANANTGYVTNYTVKVRSN